MVLKDKSKPERDLTTLSIDCYSPVQARAFGEVGRCMYAYYKKKMERKRFILIQTHKRKVITDQKLLALLALIMVLKYHFPLKIPRAAWGNDLRQELCKTAWNIRHQIARKPSKRLGLRRKDSPSRRAHQHRQDNLNKKIIASDRNTSNMFTSMSL